MAGNKPLRVATDEDAPRLPMDVTEAVLTGSRLDQLVAMRHVAAKAIDAEDTRPTDLKALMLSVAQFSKEIEELRAVESERARDAEIDNGNISTAWRPEAI